MVGLEFTMLTGWTKEDVIGQRRFIYEVCIIPERESFSPYCSHDCQLLSLIFRTHSESPAPHLPFLVSLPLTLPLLLSASHSHPSPAWTETLRRRTCWRDFRVYIWQLFENQSVVEYWENFASHAFENSTQSVYSHCVLLKPSGDPVACAFCFTIRRNMFDLPDLIIGKASSLELIMIFRCTN